MQGPDAAPAFAGPRRTDVRRRSGHGFASLFACDARLFGIWRSLKCQTNVRGCRGLVRNASANTDYSAGAAGHGRVAACPHSALRFRRVEQLPQSRGAHRRAAGALARRRAGGGAKDLSARRPGVEQRQGSGRRHVGGRHPPRRKTASPFAAKVGRADPAHPVDLDLRHGWAAAGFFIGFTCPRSELYRP